MSIHQGKIKKLYAIDMLPHGNAGKKWVKISSKSKPEDPISWHKVL